MTKVIKQNYHEHYQGSKKSKVNKKAKVEGSNVWRKENQMVRSTSKELKTLKVYRWFCALTILIFLDH